MPNPLDFLLVLPPILQIAVQAEFGWGAVAISSSLKKCPSLVGRLKHN